LPFSISALLSIIEEQVNDLDDEVLALVTKRFMCFNDNRRIRRKSNNCIECSKPDHFTIDCPNKHKNNDKYDYSKTSSLQSEIVSDPSSSEEENVCKKNKKDGKNFNGLCFYTKFGKPHGGYCIMAADACRWQEEHNEPTCEQLAIEVGKMNDCMINQDKLIKRGAHE
ncbi:hypothetical protein PVAP13_7NG131134, partial [Panicum virgatum]